MTTVIPAGGMATGKQGLLRAYLASCIGLALHDGSTGVGGLLHILLPEPVCDIPDYQKSYYASTAIPLFIDEMRAQGANIENLSAFIAGGAFIDPLSPEDMNLNIGHKTLEVTISIMKELGIPIKMLEAGGVNPFCLSFQIENGACRIESVLMDKHASYAPLSVVRSEDILHTIDTLLPIPQLAFNIAHMLSSDSVDIGSIANEIKKDQVLTADILRLCNSSYIGLPRNIESIDRAIFYLGSKLVLQMVITAQVENIYRTSDRGYSLSRGGMFHHALATARLSKSLAKAHRGIAPDTAYTAGLLHDIGKVVLDQYVADIQPLFYRMVLDEKKDSSMLEREMIGIDHCRAGSMLAERWSLPEVLKDVLLLHHTPVRAGADREIVYLVYLADVFTGKFLAGLEIEKVCSANVQEALDILGLCPQDVYDNLSVIAKIY